MYHHCKLGLSRTCSTNRISEFYRRSLATCVSFPASYTDSLKTFEKLQHYLRDDTVFQTRRAHMITNSKMQRALAKQLVQLGRALHTTALNAAAESLAGDGRASLLSLSPSMPPLLDLGARQWGPTASLPLSSLRQAGVEGSALPQHVSVVRDAFAPHNAPPTPLSSVLRSLSPQSVAVASSLSKPAHRMLVDKYERVDDRYNLVHGGMDLLRYLHEDAGLRMVHVPDVRRATDANSAVATRASVRQSTNEVLMVAPTAFGFNEQAAQDNSYMHGDVPKEGPGAASLTQTVLSEYAGLYRELADVAGVRVHLFAHDHAHGTPDAVFPNNWFSTHASGEAAGGVASDTLVLYPMKCPNRRAERRSDVIEVLRTRNYGRVLDLTAEEKSGKFFEGTGVLVLDRVNGVVFCALSERADAGLAQRWADEMGYKEVVTFHSTDGAGHPVYHTNVMMAIGTDVAVVCAESVDDPAERKHLLERLGRSHAVVQISREQTAQLCGNVLELEDGRGLPVLAMSSRAHAAFTPEQRRELRKHVAALHHAPIDTLEHVGGGGVRCAIAELF